MLLCYTYTQKNNFPLKFKQNSKKEVHFNFINFKNKDFSENKFLQYSRIIKNVFEVVKIKLIFNFNNLKLLQ